MHTQFLCAATSKCCMIKLRMFEDKEYKGVEDHLDSSTIAITNDCYLIYLLFIVALLLL